MKNTAIEFLQEALSVHFTQEEQMQFIGLFVQAKEMENKKQEKYNEMLEMLKLMVDWYSKYEENPDKYNPYQVLSAKQEDIIEEAEKLIKEATEL